MCRFGSVVLVLILCLAVLVAARGNGTSLWKTLSGNPPLVIARGGFSGLFPDSSSAAYVLASQTSLPNVILWCDVQLTKDRAGICFPELKLDNASDISSVYPKADKTYLVDGESMTGWFSVDFTLDELQNVFLNQRIYSRPPYLDGLLFPILPVQNMSQLTTARLWLNIEHDAFFTQQNLSMSSFVLSVFQSASVDYISSPEVIFLKSILSHKPKETKLIFRFRERAEIEPSTNQTYDSLSTNLPFIKTFASGILVPKTYIWPIDKEMYLLLHTSIVSDAHKEGLEVFASGFANDEVSAYDFSYDPLSECKYYFDNKDFSVDGLLSDFPITPSAAIDCYSHIVKNKTVEEKLLVISSKGSSGNYPGCTDLAYSHAIADGVDVLDCPVQMSKDGVPFCLGSINLMDSTTIVEGNYSTLQKVIPELGGISGIFTDSLTWSQIQSLTPAISNPFAKYYNLYRNPRFKNRGKFMKLSDFLALANHSSVSGVLIKIENAAYLAKTVGFSVTEAVLDALNSSQIAKPVMIESTNSSVLRKLKEESNYELVYEVDEAIRSADNLSIEEIKKFADSVVVRKSSIFPDDNAFLISMTDVVQKLHAFKLLVYVGVFRNEFVSQAWDFFSDPYVEINSFVVSAAIDGVITEYPKTAALYKKNRCLGYGNDSPPYASPVEPGSLLQIVPRQALPPADPPNPVLHKADVIEPPLPAAGLESPPPSEPAPASPTSSPSGQPRHLASLLLSCTSILFVKIFLF